MLDRSLIQPFLYQGSRPPRGHDLARRGADVLVLCAAELQYPTGDFPGVEVFHCPLNDLLDPLSPITWDLILSTAGRIARRVRAARAVLVTCAAGMNRSGIVTAAALHDLTGLDGLSCARRVQLCRPGALFNSRFVEELCGRLPARRSA